MQPDEEPCPLAPSSVLVRQIPFPASESLAGQLSCPSNFELVVAKPGAGLMEESPVDSVSHFGGDFAVRALALRAENAQLTEAAAFFGQFNLGR
jgi:hypothetical protein